MHDGAVIIRDGRVQQAGAFLPLSASTKLDKALGTRHRAALGLSQDTDAAVVVVSEERGAVSLCFRGNIVRDLDAGSLRTALLGLLTKQARKRRSTDRAEGRPSSPSMPEVNLSESTNPPAREEPAPEENPKPKVEGAN
jgi:hypothetical protein